MDINHKTNHFWVESKKKLIEAIFEKEKIRNASILEIGCADCDNYGILKKFGKITFVDSNPEFKKFLPRECEGKVASAYKLPFKDNKFDVVLIFGLLEHLENDELALKEARRVLKKGGKVVFSVPAFQFLFSSHDKAIGHYRRYSKKELDSKVRKHFRLKYDYFWNFAIFIPVCIFRLFRGKNGSKTDYMKMPFFMEKTILAFSNFETSLLKRGVGMPLGVELIGVAEK